jgi:crossover junction endodeoxyribonuclease RuvC
VIESIGQEVRYIASGCIRTPAGEDFYLRLKAIYEGIQEIIQETQPIQGAIEQVFVSQNPSSALKLGQARGAAMVSMATAGLFVAEYSARQIKQSVVGFGAADKTQVQHMVMTLLKLPKAPQADAADALAVALCHLHSEATLLKMGGARKTVHGRLRG